MVASASTQQDNASAVLLHPSDNVICLLRDHRAGERPVVSQSSVISQNSVTNHDVPALTTDVPLGHKIALRAIPKSNNVIKYGFPIGRTTCDISAGDHVHLHNLLGSSPGDTTD